MGFFRNIKESIDDKSPMSVNSVTLLISALMGIVIGLVICFVLVYDVVYDGKVDTDLTDMGIFLLCGGGYIMSSGLPKAYVDGRLKTRAWVDGEKMQTEEEDTRTRRRRKKEETSEEEEIIDP